MLIVVLRWLGLGSLGHWQPLSSDTTTGSGLIPTTTTMTTMTTTMTTTMMTSECELGSQKFLVCTVLEVRDGCDEGLTQPLYCHSEHSTPTKVERSAGSECRLTSPSLSSVHIISYDDRNDNYDYDYNYVIEEEYCSAWPLPCSIRWLKRW
jgi:hypothetical protein